MSKIIVPQELQDKIVELYNQGYGRPDIKKKLGLAFGDSVIRRILVENNIPIRTNNGAQKGGRKKQEVSQELLDKIIEAYAKGYGLDKIVHVLDLPFSFDKVRSILKDNGVLIRNYKQAREIAEQPDLRKYSINDDYILESHNGAWLLGFIAADGYLPITKGAGNRIVITLARQDEDVLEMIKNELEYTGPVYDFDATGGYPSSSLSFTSKKIRQLVEAYGIGNNKTFKLHHLPNLPNEYMIDFIAGFFDGDGSVYEPRDKGIGMSFTCASNSFLREIADILADRYLVNRVNLHEVQRVHTIYNIQYGKRDSLILGDAFYDNNYIRLPRKKKHFFEIKEKLKTH